MFPYHLVSLLAVCFYVWWKVVLRDGYEVQFGFSGVIEEAFLATKHVKE